MSIKINGEEIETVSEYFTVRRNSTDAPLNGEHEYSELAFASQEEAELDQRVYGGELRVRTAYVTFSRPVETDYPAEVPSG